MSGDESHGSKLSFIIPTLWQIEEHVVCSADWMSKLGKLRGETFFMAPLCPSLQLFTLRILILLIPPDGPVDEWEAHRGGPHQARWQLHSDGEDHGCLPRGRGEAVYLAKNYCQQLLTFSDRNVWKNTRHSLPQPRRPREAGVRQGHRLDRSKLLLYRI